MSFFKSGRKNLENLSDEAIVERILRDGEQQLLEVLYERFSNKVYHKCVALIKDREMAKDCTHDILVKVFLNLVKFEGRASFSLWVHSITYNYCIDFLKKQKKLRFDAFEGEHLEQIPDDEVERESQWLQEMKLTQLSSVFEKLNADDQIILMMRYQDDMPVKQIAETLNISESATKMRLKRSRDHLADLIESLNKKSNDGW